MVRLSVVLSLFVFYLTLTTHASEHEPEFDQVYKNYSKSLFESPNQTREKVQEFLNTNKDLMNKDQYNRFVFLLARSQIMVGDLKQTMLTLNEYRKLVFGEQDNRGKYNYYNLLSGVFSGLGYEQLALQSLEEAYKIALSGKDKRVIRQTEFNIGLRYAKLGLLDKAKRNFEGYLDHAYETSTNRKIAAALTELSELHYLKQEYDRAIELNEKALKVRKESNQLYYSYLNYMKLANNYLSIQDYEQALTVIIQAQQILEQEHNELGAKKIDLVHAKYLLKTQNYEASIELAEQVIEFADDKKLFEMHYEALDIIVQAFSSTLQFKEAFEYKKQQQQIFKERLSVQQEIAVSYLLDVKDRISKENELALISFEKEKAEIEAQNHSIKTKIVITFSLLFLIVCFWFVLKLKRKNQELGNSISDLHLALKKLEMTQQQLLENEKMRALTTLVSGMAHQMNTPLSIIKTSITTFKEQLNKKSDELQSKQLTASSLNEFFSFAQDVTKLTETSSEKTIQLIDRFKRVSAQLDQTDFSTFEFTSFLEETVKTIVETKGLQLDYEIQGKNTVVSSYKGCWIKVISQLIENSCTHAFPNTVRPKITLIIDSDGEFVSFTFEDNGEGMSPEELNRIFDPFYTTSTSEGSVGLGLNIVYNAIVQMMKGTIECRSDDKGTGFLIKFPIKKE